MAVAYASSDNGTLSHSGGSNNLVITKPSGLAEGDMMIALCGINGDDADFTLTGWTTFFTANDGSNRGLRGLFKVASSADAAGSDFSFSINGSSGDGCIGSILRITGTSFVGEGNIISDTDVNTPGATNHVFTSGITPHQVSSILIHGCLTGGLVTTSAYAITNDNPSWTERQDFQINATSDATLAFATALASAVSASGDWTLTISSSINAIGFLISVEEVTDVTVSPAVVNLLASFQDPSITGSAVVSPAVVNLTVSPQDPTVTTPESKWKNNAKSDTSPTITNNPKS